MIIGSSVFRYHRGAMRILVWILVAGCGYPKLAPLGDDTGTGDAGSDPGSSAARDIPHVPAAFEQPGTSDIVLANGTMIDTTTLTIAPGVDAAIDMVGQEPGGPELMLIRARSVTIPAGAVVHATGSRSLVILAERIAIAGTLDAAGHLDKPGPNGGTLAVPSSMGTGGNGDHKNSFSDSGGGGGGYGTVAGIGGKGSANAGSCSPATNGGVAGALWGSAGLEELRGGAAGGQGAAIACTKAVPGAGGGAVQLSALSRITIEPGGVLQVGGGGGGGGINCGGSETGAGSGGGAGGALFLDAPVIVHDGTLAANAGPVVVAVRAQERQAARVAMHAHLSLLRRVVRVEVATARVGGMALPVRPQRRTEATTPVTAMVVGVVGASDGSSCVSRRLPR